MVLMVIMIIVVVLTIGTLEIIYNNIYYARGRVIEVWIITIRKRKKYANYR